ncbi:unnamed protein product [Amoebophrya sp. A25]|nr:unnamed protein product [Amoebophrya sp. A25]|eukprot:GSA25T00002098001.1
MPLLEKILFGLMRMRHEHLGLLQVCARSFHFHQKLLPSLRDATLSRILGSFTYFNYQDPKLYQLLIRELVSRVDKMGPMSVHHMIVGLQRQIPFLSGPGESTDWLADAVRRVCGRIASDTSFWTLAQTYGTLNALAKIRVRETRVLHALVRRLVIMDSQAQSNEFVSWGTAPVLAATTKSGRSKIGKDNSSSGRNAPAQSGTDASFPRHDFSLPPQHWLLQILGENEDTRTESMTKEHLTATCPFDLQRTRDQWALQDCAFASSVLHSLDQLQAWSLESVWLALILRAQVEPRLHDLRCRELVHLGLAFRDLRMSAGQWKLVQEAIAHDDAARKPSDLNAGESGTESGDGVGRTSKVDDVGLNVEQADDEEQDGAVEDANQAQDWRHEFFHSIVEHLRRHEAYATSQPDAQDKLRLLKSTILLEMDGRVEQKALDLLDKLSTPSRAEGPTASASSEEASVDASKKTHSTVESSSEKEDGSNQGVDENAARLSLLELEVLNAAVPLQFQPQRVGGAYTTAVIGQGE